MNYSCSQCDFTARFESALRMHHQLHHEGNSTPSLPNKIYTMARMQQSSLPTIDKILRQREDKSPSSSSTGRACRQNVDKDSPIEPTRKSSATRMFCKLRARICGSRSRLFPHPEETMRFNDIAASECTSKALNMETVSSSASKTICSPDAKETYGCHLCNFEADRITVLDRHLLNDHKIGLESLLKLVLAKTNTALHEDQSPILGIRQPYYQPVDEIVEAGDYLIETVTPRVRILKHASTNTDPIDPILISDSKIANFKDDYLAIMADFQTMMKERSPIDKCDSNLLDKMQTLNACMCQLVNSSNMVDKVLKDKLEANLYDRSTHLSSPFDLGLGDQDSPRYWERAHSEKLQRNNNKFGEKCTTQNKAKSTGESFYF